MPQLSYYLLTYRADLLLLVGLSIGAYQIVRRSVRHKAEHRVLSRWLPWFVGCVVVIGGATAEWVARDRVQSLQQIFMGFLPTYASELEKDGHEFITAETPADDPRYLNIIEHEKRWLATNGVVADIYTFRADNSGRIYLVVDSETDYDRNGRFEGEKEQRTPIGERYAGATPNFHRALKGEVVFEDQVMLDRWGVWVSSFAPIYGRDGRVEAAVGVDYPADRWLHTIGTVRAVCLGLSFILIVIVLVGSGFIAVLSDEIEQRKAAQKRLESATESAVCASAAKSEFLALMSHEVRTPLSAILGFATILSETRLDAIQRRYTDTINRAGTSLLELLNGILDYTRLENGQPKVEQIPWAPALVIHEVMELLSIRAREKNLQFNFDNHLPDGLTLSGDPSHIRQILLNLVSNAINFTEKGQVTVNAQWTPDRESQDRGRFVVEVLDTGVGIPAEKLPLLFQAFSQVETSTTRSKGGAGLGLAISHRLAQSMQGTIEVLSKVGVGSTFSFGLHARSVSGAASSGNPARGTAQAVAKWGRALIVDDTRLNRELLKVMLQRLGLEADVAASGLEGIRLASERHYKVIFMDLEMPEMDGFTTADAIRRGEPEGVHAPIVAVSALTATGTREKCIASGMDDYIIKPVYLPALKAIVESIRVTGISRVYDAPLSTNS
ncbi:MAG TPA: ATP-binding protein [Opitutaceae bacterium]|nr:ATP-binding protein [Opitutaceae bacterium]